MLLARPNPLANTPCQSSLLSERAERIAFRLQADDAREAAGLARKKQKGEEPDAEPSYRRWSIAKWNELETKEQSRRSVPIDRSRTDHNHYRRRLVRFPGLLREGSGGLGHEENNNNNKQTQRGLKNNAAR